MKKKIIILFLSVGLGVGLYSPLLIAAASPPIKIVMYAEQIGFYFLETDVFSIVDNDYTLLPLRVIAEELDYAVSWDPVAQHVMLVQGENRIELMIDSPEVQANGRKDIMPVATKIVDSRTYIPLRYVAEFFGQKVLWDDEIFGQPYIWISPLDLITQADVDVPNDNYNVLNEDLWPYYELKDTGTTARGIKLGDTYEQVIAAYGDAPYKKYDAHELTNYAQGLEYIQAWLPESGAPANLGFYFDEDGILTYAGIDPPF
jgi:hypothetical protein